MSFELKIPEVGESITEVQISEWLKAEGDEVKADEAVAVIDSEKTTFELPAPRAGRLTHILHKAGDTVKVGEAIGQIEADGASTPEKPVAAAAKEAAPSAGAAAETKPEPKSGVGPGPRRKKETKAVEKAPSPIEATSEAKGDEPERQAPKSGPDEAKARPRPEVVEGPISSRAGRAAEKGPPAPADDREFEVVPLSMLRRTVARRLVAAQQTMAMLTTFNEVDMTAVQKARADYGEAFEKRYQVRLGLMSFFVKAAIDALKQFPQLNAELRDTEIVYHNYFDIGVAIATDRGLVVPVLRRAECLSFAEVEKAIGDFAQRARTGGLKPDELAGGTFTITNGGVFGSLLSTPIINPPQTGILGLHTIQKRPVAVDEQVVIRPLMYLALTYDHRLVDGREAVLFLRRVKDLIENPARMLIEI
jgi:2-oxoglutarate dehydrogenase E2 component (dihydrolipoamide succinyltransferase)